jgi:hypothetical protein
MIEKLLMSPLKVQGQCRLTALNSQLDYFDRLLKLRLLRTSALMTWNFWVNTRQYPRYRNPALQNCSPRIRAKHTRKYVCAGVLQCHQQRIVSPTMNYLKMLR